MFLIFMKSVRLSDAEQAIFVHFSPKSAELEKVALFAKILLENIKTMYIIWRGIINE